jgi:hypothetical protein
MRILSKLGFDYLQQVYDSGVHMLDPLFKARLSETVETAREIMQGKLNGDKVLTYMVNPPANSQRGDLTQGSTKLLFGDTADISFIAMHDKTGEIIFILNTHEEEGIPTDWSVIGPEDELLERRHPKLGFKLKELPSKTKNLTNCGLEAIRMLKENRNERTRYWSTSAYYVAFGWMCGVVDQLFIRSSWEGFASIWDAANAKRAYGLPDFCFGFVPWPSLLHMLLMMTRPQWTARICGLMTGHKLYLQGMENVMINWLSDKFPEVYNEILKESIEKIGIPLPIQTLECQPPHLKDKQVSVSENFAWHYPRPKEFIFPDDLELGFDTFLKGVFLNVTHETTEKVTRSHILSYGIGKNTKLV